MSIPESPESAYFKPLAAGRYGSSELTRGPWDAASQHAGPPSALIAREIERCPGIGAGPGERLVARITLEILRPVPIGELALDAVVVRPGRRVDLVEATLKDAEGPPLVLARAWRILRSELELPEPPPDAGRSAPPPPESLPEDPEYFPTGHEVGYHSSIDIRFASGGFMESGPAVCWIRLRQPLVAGEQPSPLQRVLAAADSGNGVSSPLDYRTHLFVNVELSVHLHRMPEGEWIGLDALTIPEPTGVGLTDTLLLDRRGPIGRANQTLLVAAREPAA